MGTVNTFCLSDVVKIWLGHTSWPWKQVCARIYHLSQNPRWPPGVKVQKSTKFDPTNHILARHLVPVHQIWKKFGMDILLDLYLLIKRAYFHIGQKSIIYGSRSAPNWSKNVLNFTFITFRNRKGSFLKIEIERSCLIYGE